MDRTLSLTLLFPLGIVVYAVAAPRFHLPGPPIPLVLLAMLTPLSYVVVKKRRARASLERLLAARFGRPVASPVPRLAIARGGEFVSERAFGSTLAGRPFLLLLGRWRRGTVRAAGGPTATHLNIAGVYFPQSEGVAWLERVARGDVLAAAPWGASGAVVLWADLASGPSVSAHLDELERALLAEPPR